MYICNVKRNQQNSIYNNKKTTIMKKYKIILVTFIGVVIAALAIAIEVLDNDKVIPAGQLPLAAKDYVEQNYPGSSIAYAKIENDIIFSTYKVRLDNGLELEFDNDGFLKDIDD